MNAMELADVLREGAAALANNERRKTPRDGRDRLNEAFADVYGADFMAAVSREFWTHFDEWGGESFQSDEHQVIALCLVAAILDDH